jgi:hypothetical protein
MAKPFVDIDTGYSRVLRYEIFNDNQNLNLVQSYIGTPGTIDLEITNELRFTRIDYKHELTGRCSTFLGGLSYIMGVDNISSVISILQGPVGLIPGKSYPSFYVQEQLQPPGKLQGTQIEPVIYYSMPFTGGFDPAAAALAANSWNLRISFTLELICYY